MHPRNTSRRTGFINYLCSYLSGIGLLLLLPMLTAAQRVPACNGATQQTNRINGLCLLCNIGQPAAAIDTSQATYSTLSVPVGLLGVYAEQTLIFPFTGASTDSIQLLLSFPANLLELSAISKVEIATYNGATYNNDRQSVYTPAAVILLLTAPNQVLVTFSPGHAYDRIAVRLSTSLISALGSVNIHYAARKLPPPTLTSSSVTICENAMATLTATAPTGMTLHWYDSPDAANSIATGSTYTTPSLFNTRTYYVAAAPGSGCASGSRASVSVNIHNAPPKPFITATDFSVCSGSTTTLQAGTPDGQFYKWYSQEAGGSVLFTGSSYTPPPLSHNTDFFAATIDSFGCTSLNRHGVTVQVKPIPEQPAVSKKINCKDEYSDLHITFPAAHTDYRWYYNANDTLPQVEDVDFSPLISSARSFFVTATYNGCTSIPKEVEVTPLPPPAAPVLVSSVISACAGDSITLIARSPEDVLFVWLHLVDDDFDFTLDSVLKVAPIETSAYFSIAYAANGCFSDSVTPAIVIAHPRPSTPVAVADTVTINAGQSASLEVLSVDSVITRWFVSATGDSSIAAGDTFITPPLYQDTVFYAAAFSNTVCASYNRIPVWVRVLPEAPLGKGSRSGTDAAPAPMASGSDAAIAFPNPFADQFSIRYPVIDNSRVVIELFNQNGQRIALLKDENTKSGIYEVLYNNNKLPAGIYQCRITTNNSTKVLRLVKQ